MRIGTGHAARAGAVALALAITVPVMAQAGSEAHRISAPVGGAVQIITPPPSGFSSFVQPVSSASGRSSPLSPKDGGDRSVFVSETVQAVPDRGAISVVLLVSVPYCQRGLFGRAINAPCRIRPDATILNRR